MTRVASGVPSTAFLGGDGLSRPQRAEHPAVVRYHDDRLVVLETPDDLDPVCLVIVVAVSDGADR